MSRGFRMGGGTISKSKEQIIYDNGSWSVGYDNPGEYYRTGWTVIGGTLGTNKITLSVNSANTVSLIGISSPINITKYSTLHVLCKGVTTTSGSSYYGTIVISSTKEYSNATNPPYKGLDITSNVEHEVAMDISELSGNGYISIRTQINTAVNRSCEVYKIWLT